MHTPLVPAGTSSLYVLFSLSAFITITNPCLIIRKPVFNSEYCFVCIFSLKKDIMFVCVCFTYFFFNFTILYWFCHTSTCICHCHFLLQCMKVKSESEVTQSCRTLSDPMDCSPPGSSIHGIFQARILEWGAIAFSSY